MEELGRILSWEGTAQPVSPDPRAYNAQLQTKFNICYIVAGVVWNEAEEVLLIQEAKESCRGKWYLPAGRVEPNETLLEAVRREVLEEAGVEFEPEAVIALEHNSQGYWIRITFAGRITGGSLKTTAQADKESLQADWFKAQALGSTPIRARDIMPLLEVGKKWYGMVKERRHRGLPPPVGHTSLSRRLVVIHRKEDQFWVLVRRSEECVGTRFPVSKMGHREMEGTLKALGCAEEPELKGLLSLEHLGKPHGQYDGMCLSVLLETSGKELKEDASVCWNLVDHSLTGSLRKALDSAIPVVERW